jgi:hypothetical protein
MWIILICLAMVGTQCTSMIAINGTDMQCRAMMMSGGKQVSCVAPDGTVLLGDAQPAGRLK